MLLEAPRVWLRPRAESLALLREIDGLAHYEAARAAGKAIVLLTPHSGCFEICAQAFAERHPITVLYRPSKQAWLQPMIDQRPRAAGREPRERGPRGRARSCSRRSSAAKRSASCPTRCRAWARASGPSSSAGPPTP